MYDVIIIGMGIGGITAGIYTKQANLNVLMFEARMPGGILNNIDNVDNYTGFPSIKGPDFAMNLLEQVNKLEIPFKNEEVIKINVTGDIKKVYTKNSIYETKNIVIATGRKPKFLGLDNESKLLGKGLSTCALCDGNFYNGKDIAVVGGGNSALQEALYLSNIVNKIYLIVRRNEFRANKTLENLVKANPKIEIKFETKIEKINEVDGVVKNIELNTNEIIDVSGVFLYVGYTPDNKLIKHLDILDETGYIVVDEFQESKIEGIYGVGDIIKKDLYQLINAASEGALAANHIINKR